MRSLKILIIVILFSSPVNANMKNAFDFKFDSIDGKELNLQNTGGIFTCSKRCKQMWFYKSV